MMRQPHVGRWHLYFNGEPVLIGHICDLHRAIANDLDCADKLPDSDDCEHVQTRLCLCAMYECCDICEAEPVISLPHVNEVSR